MAHWNNSCNGAIVNVIFTTVFFLLWQVKKSAVYRASILADQNLSWISRIEKSQVSNAWRDSLEILLILLIWYFPISIRRRNPDTFIFFIYDCPMLDLFRSIFLTYFLKYRNKLSSSAESLLFLDAHSITSLSYTVSFEHCSPKNWFSKTGRQQLHLLSIDGYKNWFLFGKCCFHNLKCLKTLNTLKDNWGFWVFNCCSFFLSFFPC